MIFAQSMRAEGAVQIIVVTDEPDKYERVQLPDGVGVQHRDELDRIQREFREIKGIMDQYEDFKINLWCFDTAIYNHQEFTQDNSEELFEYEPEGGGGTDFDAHWEYMKNYDINPKKFIMFTDGYPCGSWGDEEYCDSLFIVHGNETIVSPFGQTAYYK